MKRILLTLAVVAATFAVAGNAQAQYPHHGHHHHHHGYYGGYGGYGGGYGYVPPVRVYANIGTPYYGGYAPGAYAAPYSAGYGGYAVPGYAAPVYPQRGIGLYYGY